MKICKKCGAADFSASGSCRPCNSAAVAKYRAKVKNSEKATHTCVRCGSLFVGIYCKPCKAAQNVAYRAAYPERVKAQRAAYYAANSARELAAAAKRYAEDLEKSRAARRAQYKANPKASIRHNQNRRARKKAYGGVLSKGILEKLFKLQKGKCACCKKPLGDDYHLDHIMPLALGGTNTDDNMQLLTATCNLQKNAKHPIEFMQSRGLLL